MLSRHEERAQEYRALAAAARASGGATDLVLVQDRHDAAAARWEALAAFEDLYVRNAEARRQALEAGAEPAPPEQGA